MKIRIGLLICVVLIAVLAFLRAETFTTDFESRSINPWTVQTTPQGTVTSSRSAPFPDVVLFDINQNDKPSLAARFQVGRQTLIQASPMPPEGGSIYQDIYFSGGNYNFDIDIAASTWRASPDAGTFFLYFDGQLIDSHSFGAIKHNEVLTSNLSGKVPDIEAGNYRVEILITRSLVGGSLLTPFQYVDNIHIASLALAEPTTCLILVLTILAALIVYRSRPPIKQ